jgi:hypothetical protein
MSELIWYWFVRFIKNIPVKKTNISFWYRFDQYLSDLFNITRTATGVNTPAYHFVRVNSGHLELKDNLSAISDVTKPVHC